MISVEDFAARLRLYKSELPRRGLVLALVGYLPVALLLIAAAYYFNIFSAGDWKLIAFAVAFSVISIAFMAYFLYLALRALPAKIGLLCPHCHTFSVIYANPQQLRETGCCPKCGGRIFEV